MMRALLISLLLPALLSCRRGEAEKPQEAESWAVTTWGDVFEVFPEIDPLVAGTVARAHTHVTVLSDFSPVRSGVVGAVLKDGQGREEVFEQRTPRRDGIFVIEVKPSREGEFDLSFRVSAAGRQEEIPGGRVKVGSAAAPGGLLEPPPPPHGTATADDVQGMSFLKEQQWRTPFATEWTKEGSLAASVVAPARVVAPSGGEVLLTAPVDALVLAQPWPHRGQAVGSGAAVFQLVPKVESARSLAELEADVASLENDATVARARADRLTELLKVEATSRAELERAKAAQASLEARLAAARRDLGAARASRTGGRIAAAIAVGAPWAGQVAELSVSPGQSVAAGAPLARLVKARPVWLDVALRPEDAAKLASGTQGLFVRRPSDVEPFSIPRDALRVVSRAPEVDVRTGTVGVLVEVSRSTSDLPIGSSVEAEILLPGEQRGVVIPSSALVDDNGVLVAYEQVSGETFVRREVAVRARQGAQTLVTGLQLGTRLVTRGGAAVRRASLLSAGAPEGHVH